MLQRRAGEGRSRGGGEGKSMPGVFVCRAKLLERVGLPDDAFLPSALQKEGQQWMKQRWLESDQGHTRGISLQPLLQRRA